MEGTAKGFVFPFERLEVWQLAVDFADYVLGLMESLPTNRHLRLIGQTEASVCSVSQNIAEGKGRQYKKEFVQYLHVAEGSLFEVLTLAEIFRRRDLLKETEIGEIRARAEVIDRKIHGLINSLRGNPRTPG
jgi:four helix bundle protein